MSHCLNLPVECVLDIRNTLGESPVWDAREQALYWVDILEAKIYRWQPTTQALRHWQLPAAVGCIGLREQGGLVLAMRSGFHLFDLQSEALTFLQHPEAHLASNRFNDGKVSPEGRFWAGTMDDRPEKETRGSLYRLDADYRCSAMAHDVKVSNGLAWSPDGRTLYHSCSRLATIFRHAYDPLSGTLGPRQIWVELEAEWGRPDGAAMDEEGCYWSCGVSRGRINRFSPQGELIEYLPVPVSHPTMPCFAGPDLKTLYFTSSREGFSPEMLAHSPLAGGVFKVELKVAGTRVGLFKG